jgi:uncharacterized protein YkwD
MARPGRTAASVALLGALLLAFIAAPAQAGPAGDAIDKINGLRSDHGLRTLRVASSLMQSADAYSERMLDDQYFGHARRIQASSRYEYLGEILEWHRGRNPDPGWAFRDWLGSPTHLRVMLDPRFTYIGAGYATGRFFGHTDTIWTVHFGRL